MLELKKRYKNKETKTDDETYSFRLSSKYINVLLKNMKMRKVIGLNKESVREQYLYPLEIPTSQDFQKLTTVGNFLPTESLIIVMRKICGFSQI